MSWCSNTTLSACDFWESWGDDRRRMHGHSLNMSRCTFLSGERSSDRLCAMLHLPLFIELCNFYFGLIFILFWGSAFCCVTLSRLLEEPSLATTLQGVYFIFHLFCLCMFRPLLAIFRWSTQFFYPTFKICMEQTWTDTAWGGAIMLTSYETRSGKVPLSAVHTKTKSARNRI
jgi:hypothetical protein